MRLTKEAVKDIVQDALAKLSSNPLELEVAPDGVRRVDTHWWVVLLPRKEPEFRHLAWEQAAMIGELLDEDRVRAKGKINVTIA